MMNSSATQPQPSRARKFLHQPQHDGQQQQQQGSGGGSSLIQANSVHHQFSALSNDRDKFRRERDAAEKELEQVLAGYTELKKQLEELVKKNVHVKAELGEQSKKLRMLKEEKNRILRLIENDGKALTDCSNHIKALVTKKGNAKRKFTADMDHVNFEIADLLNRRLEKKTERYISVQSVEAIVLPKLEEEKQGGNHLKKNVHDSLGRLKKATDDRNEALARFRHLKSTLRQSGFDMEAIINGEDRHLVPPGQGSTGPTHMYLFYGSEVEGKGFYHNKNMDCETSS